MCIRDRRWTMSRRSLCSPPPYHSTKQTWMDCRCWLVWKCERTRPGPFAFVAFCEHRYPLVNLCFRALDTSDAWTVGSAQRTILPIGPQRSFRAFVLFGWSHWSLDKRPGLLPKLFGCLLYTSDAADERSSVDLGGRRIIKKKNITKNKNEKNKKKKK